ASLRALGTSNFGPYPSGLTKSMSNGAILLPAFDIWAAQRVITTDPQVTSISNAVISDIKRGDIEYQTR
ncbi:MAG TPA: hypothetical protein VHY33_13940, partial [Thermoanaerobaculia bacterium]|nr:hypothetical protein [Thermoanaerobaculia bacterium]